MHRSGVMWILAAIGLVVAWLALKVVWGIASIAVHFLLGAAAVALVVHFAQKYFGRRRAHAAT